MNAQEAIEYLAVYAHYATDNIIRLPDGRYMHVSDFCAEIAAQPCHWCEMANDPNNQSVTVCPFHPVLTHPAR